MLFRSPILALSLLLPSSIVSAKCLPQSTAANSCRYVAGDSWCSEHDRRNPYAYSDSCLASAARSSKYPPLDASRETNVERIQPSQNPADNAASPGNTNESAIRPGSTKAKIKKISGGKNATSVSYPQLEDKYYTKVNKRISAEAKKTLASQVSPDEQADEDTTECELVGVTPKIVSLRCKNFFYYAGGAHPTTSYWTYNYGVATDGSAQDLGLWDLLKKSPENASFLADWILRTLQRQGAGEVTGTDLGCSQEYTFAECLARDEAVSFAVTPAGLVFYASPYMSLGFDEETGTVVVPYDRLKPFVRRDGLLAKRTRGN